MKLTATSGGIDIADGVYPATLMSIEEQAASEGHEDWGPQLKWIFHVYDTDEGQEIPTWSSMRFGPKAKARKWLQTIAGKQFAPGEEVEPATLCPADCQVIIKKDPESGFSKIMDVLAARKHPTASKAAKNAGVVV